MVEEFHDLANVCEVPGVTALEISRARAIAEAVTRHRDYSLVRLLASGGNATPAVECVVVDVECDGVPSRNRIGINYRERLALCVPVDPKELVEVLALRKSFPVLLHQNHGSRVGPASLCLYFEAPTAVLRTWTAQNFLRRIQWWLEMSAKGELHAADQPLEHLFFVSKYELVLPWNFETMRTSPEHRSVIYRGAERPDEGVTFLMDVVAKDTPPAHATAAYVELDVPLIVHGFVERDPSTLGELAYLLARRRVDVVEPLRDALRGRVDPRGTAAAADDTWTVILVRVPVCREEGTAPDRVVHRAFLVRTGALHLGVAVGALFLLDKKYYSAVGVPGADAAVEWRAEPILAMDVLQRNDPAAARRQSGIEEEGPEGVLVGVGSLGSAMLNLWGRSGWGRWTVIDKDHVKPHNLSRHVAHAHHVGFPKAEVVVADLNRSVMQRTSEVRPLNADAFDLSKEAVIHALSAASLVVDASTTLEYPRLASATEGLGRHVSLFLTPNGNAAVLMIEDQRRDIRLRTLEAQYYGAVIREDWGQHHLEGNVGRFWSGASCRDISTVMPYSRITAHASTLAEQVPMAAARAGALIRVWQRDAQRGAVSVCDVQVWPEHRFPLDGLDLFIDAGVEQRLRVMRTTNLPNETGGVLLGYHDLNIHAIVIVDTLSAPPDSRSAPGSFERGIEGLAEAIKEASRRTADVVGYVGEWHSHPPGYPAVPSRDDVVQLIHLALGMADDGLPAVQLIVGEHDLKVLQGKVNG